MSCNTAGMLTLFYYIKIAMNIIFIGAPILLLLLGTIDFLKVVTAGDEKKMKKSVDDFVKRVIICVLILILPILINLVMSTLNVKSYTECYKKATRANINKLDIEATEKYYQKAYESLSRSDYILAINSLNNVKDSNTKKALKNKLDKLGTYIALNEKIVNSTSSYSKLKNEINKINDATIREKLLKNLNSSNGTPLNLQVGTYERSDYDSEMRYIEVIPEGATTNMPLVIYLHGIWSYASFSSNAPNYKITNYVKSGKAYNYGKFILVVPRFVLSQGDNRGIVTWHTSQGRTQTAKLKGLIDFLVDKYKINNKKIIITGVSLGGDGTWNMVESYPDLFSAAVPISGCAGNSAVASKYVKTPIIAYHGTGYNEDSYKQCVPAIYRKIKNAGGNIKLVVKNGYSHAMMQNVYTDDNGAIFKWMLEQ